MRGKTVLIIVVELVMAVFGLLLGWEWAKPLPQPPSHEMAVWLPMGPEDKGLAADWLSQQATVQKWQGIEVGEFQSRHFEAILSLVSKRSVIYGDYSGVGPYLTYFGRDAQRQIWAAEEPISRWLPVSQLPPQPYRSEDYRLDVSRRVVEVSTSYSLLDAAIILLASPVLAAVLPLLLRYVLKFLGWLIYAFFGFFGIRFQSPFVRD